jgi:hypothetical protein
MDSQDLAGPIFHPLVATSYVFWHNQCCRGGVQAHSMIEAIACTDCSQQSALIPLLLKEGGVLVPPNLHKITLVGPPSIRDDLHSYLLPLLF